jgi:hypothetical protein
VAAGAPFTAATLGSMQSLQWDPSERWVAAVAAFDAAANAGRLEVRDTSTGALVFSADGVPPAGFSLGDGSAVAAVRAWDDALLRGELVVQPLGAAGDAIVAPQVTSFLAPVRGRVVYVARGAGLDGLWLR